LWICAAPVAQIHKARKTIGKSNKEDSVKPYSRTISLATICLVIMVIAVACTPSAAPTPTNSIQGIVWEWTSVTDQATKETTSVPSPENYTITFNADSTLNGKADCNTFNGTYSQENGLIIKLGATTMAFCGEASLDQQYLQLLGSIVAGGPDGQGNLALETAGGAQRMIFANGGNAGK
jgi:heat shock protein HslJ